MEQDIRAVAADPATPPHVMQSLAGDHPEVWVALAGNPSLYPDLRQWLIGTGDPEVLAVLRPEPVPVDAPATDVPPVPEVDAGAALAQMEQPDVDVMAVAADPATPPHVMQSLAGDHPEVWVALAGNPSLYPDLRQWLLDTGDPGVLAVLQPEHVLVDAHGVEVPQLPEVGVVSEGDVTSEEDLVLEADRLSEADTAAEDAAVSEALAEDLAADLSESPGGVVVEGQVESADLDVVSEDDVVLEMDAATGDAAVSEVVTEESPAPTGPVVVDGWVRFPGTETDEQADAIPDLPPWPGAGNSADTAALSDVPPLAPAPPVPQPSMSAPPQFGSVQAPAKPSYALLVFWIILVVLLTAAAVVLGYFLLERGNEFALQLADLTAQVGGYVA